MRNIDVIFYGLIDRENSVIFYFTINSAAIAVSIYTSITDKGEEYYKTLLNEACGYATLCYMGERGRKSE